MDPSTAARPPRRSGKRILAACASGNFVEWLDFSLYGFSATVIAQTFFPADSGVVALLGTFAIYGVAFVARPAGGIVFSRIGDRLGRRAALSASIVMMGLATVAIGLLPSYETAGIGAPILLLVCRLAQGFSAGGEYTGAATFTLEHAPPGRRALWTTFVHSFSLAGTLAGILVILLFRFAAPEAYSSGGWRWTFVAVGLLAGFGLYLRLRLDETPVYRELRADGTARIRPLKDVVRQHARQMVVLFAYYAYVGVLTYLITGYMPTYLTKVVGFESTTALVLQAAVVVFQICLFLVLARLIDSGRAPRRRLVIIGSASGVVLAVPAFLLITTGTVWAGFLGMSLLSVPIILTTSGAMLIAMEMLPTDARFTGVALPYNLAYALFAGTAPLVSELLVTATGNSIMPAVYATSIAVVALPVLFFGMPETKDFHLGTGTAEPSRSALGRGNDSSREPNGRPELHRTTGGDHLA
ncbi:MFS transporter [Saccharopolyspora sp. NPDC050389]|uniref:MFS transporter n=1 Tax=Saccharopolyspora sp. NPDC050389 TaxID=3155516 RepID=UPI0033DE4E43